MLRLVLFLIALAGFVSAQPVDGRYIVELAAEPALAKATPASALRRMDAVRAGQDRLRSLLAERGLRVTDSFTLLINAVVVEAGAENAQAIAAMPGVRRVSPVQVVRKYLDRALPLQRVPEAWDVVGGVANAGRGVKIGIIDSGIDASHPAFQDSDLTVPDGFPKVNNSSDLGNTNSKIIVARSYDSTPLSSARDRDGHGTAVAMIAAGNIVTGPAGVITGVAPKAFLGNYKVFPDDSETASTDAVLRALEDAVADGMDVINLSLGSFPAQLPANDFMVEAAERAASSGVLIVVAAGNEGPDPGTIGSPGTAPSVITVGSASSDRTFAPTVRVPNAAPYVAVPASTSEARPDVSAPLRNVADIDPSSLACEPLGTDSLAGQVAFILRGTCFFEEKLRNAQRAGAVAAIVYSHGDDPDPVTMDAGTVTLPAVMLSNRDGLDLQQRLQSAGTLNVQIGFVPSSIPVDPNRLARSSSRGPAAGAALKPELIGIGAPVYTAGIASQQGGFTVSSGTSLSSPMVAGAAALLKAARPGLTTEQYRSLLVNGSSTFSYDAVMPGPVQQTGAGLLNVTSAVRSTIAATPAVVNFYSGGASTLQTVVLNLANLGTAEDTYSISVQGLGPGPVPTVQTNTLSLAGGETRAVGIRFEATNLTAAEYQGFIVIRGSVSDSEARVPWWYGVASNAVATVTALPRRDSGTTGSTQQIFARPTDLSGLPVDVTPAAEAVEGGGSVSRVSRSPVYPGFFVVEVRLGTAAGPNVFEVSAGGKSTRVTIAGE